MVYFLCPGLQGTWQWTLKRLFSLYLEYFSIVSSLRTTIRHLGAFNLFNILFTYIYIYVAVNHIFKHTVLV